MIFNKYDLNRLGCLGTQELLNFFNNNFKQCQIIFFEVDRNCDED